jgi:hypothetical protein
MYVNSKGSCNIEKNNTNSNIPMTNNKIKIKVNSQTFTATLLNNKSVKAFKEILPLTMKMTELNGNEKYFELPNSLPTNSYNPQTIKNGDLMLYGTKTLVLFYETFPTPYSYTKLGSLDDVTGLTTALGSGNVTVTFELD